MAISKPPIIPIAKDSVAAGRLIKKLPRYDSLSKVTGLKSAVGRITGLTHPSAGVINKTVAKILPKVLNFKASKERIAYKLKEKLGIEYESANNLISLIEYKKKGLTDKQKKTNIKVDARMSRLKESGLRVRPHAGETVKNKAADTREEVLMGSVRGINIKSAEKPTRDNVVQGPWGSGAQGLTHGDEVHGLARDGKLTVATMKGTGFAGEKSKVAPTASSLRPANENNSGKKSNTKPGSPVNLGHQDKLAVNQ